MDFQYIKITALFFEGVLSFFSPCVIPIIPIYLSVFAGKKSFDNNGNAVINKKFLIANSLFFVLGISLTFFILAFATSYLSIFLNTHSNTLQIFSAVLIIFMGLSQVRIFNFKFLKKEFSFKNNFKNSSVNPIISFLMGFSFSFSWTPCIGPILASVFLYATSQTATLGVILIIIYCLGFILPFLIISLFSSKLLTFIRNNGNFLKYSTYISGVILILIGFSILTGTFNCFINKYII